VDQHASASHQFKPPVLPALHTSSKTALFLHQATTGMHRLHWDLLRACGTGDDDG
jgi:hypothetical protein